ncbi:MAG TPA: glycoside hydrolase family 38 C-terminal domain-containing protein, partial [Candidatus Acidoferrales bacterium]|nr:glycoside hydrolase family 38 C-terminal domain-containing protein [Candidatus Acidoferrales bacterium]
EEASAAAAWLGGRPYPLERLNHAWRLVLGGQFHDIMAGTATPKSYEYSWNDDVIAMNQFAGVLSSATESIASQLDTQGKGAAIVVFNPLSIQREDVVQVTLPFSHGAPSGFNVTGPDGKEVPSQIDETTGDSNNGAVKVLFFADVPSVGFAVYHMRPSYVLPVVYRTESPKSSVADAASHLSSDLKVTDSSLENARYRIQLNHDGDVSSIFDKKLNRELLSAPARLAFQTEKPSQWPAWNMDWSDQSKPPRSYAGGPAKITIAEHGPVRVALQIEREAEGSKFVQTIRLSAGDAGNRVEFANSIDWKTREAALKATFPLTASNQTATYNWGAGTLERPTDNEKMFEMPSHRWFDLTDQSGGFGVTILSGAKTGSDRPNDNTLRLTLLYTPGVSAAGQSYRDQGSQDFGHHEFVYGLSSHAGGWRDGGTAWQAYRLDAPLIAFETTNHRGALGKTLSLLKVSDNGVRVMAFKKAEDSNDEVVRLVEMNGKPQRDIRISFAAPVIAAHEINGQELPVGPASIAKGDLLAEFAPYEIKSYEVKLAPSHVQSIPPHSEAIPLHYDLAAASNDGTKSVGGFDTAGNALPAELLPSEIAYSGIHFKLAPAATGKPDAVIARGQTIQLPAGKFNRVYFLAASADGDQQATFKLGDQGADLTIQNWGGYVGQWYDRSFTMEPRPIPPEPDASDTSERAQRIRRRIADLQKNPETLPHFASVTPGFIKRAPIAWFASHHHTPDGANVPYGYSYLFAYVLDLPPGARTITLPDNDKIRILAISVSNEPAQTHPAQPLYDTTEQVAGRQ